jgi:hypothetical protein
MLLWHHLAVALALLNMAIDVAKRGQWKLNLCHCGATELLIILCNCGACAVIGLAVSQ